MAPRIGEDIRIYPLPQGGKVILETYQLLGDAEYWWRNTKLMMEGAYEKITWVTFKQKFLAKYFPETTRERSGQEFLKLRVIPQNFPYPFLP